MNRRAAVALILIGTILFGFMGIHTRSLHAAGLLSESVAFFRLLLSVILFGIALLLFRREWLIIRKEHILLFLLIGVSKALMDLTLIDSQDEVTLGFASAMQMTAPVFVIILSFIVYRERFTRYGVAGALVCIVGTVLYSGALIDPDPISTKGLAAGIVCGISTAAFMMLTKELLERGYHPVAILFYAFLVALVVITPFAYVPEAIQIVSGEWDLIYHIIMLGIFCTVIPFTVIAIAQKYMDTLRASIYTTFEIVAAAIVGFLVYHEYLDLTNMLGILMIIIAIAIMAVGDEKSKAMREAQDQT